MEVNCKKLSNLKVLEKDVEQIHNLFICQFENQAFSETVVVNFKIHQVETEFQ